MAVTYGAGEYFRYNTGQAGSSGYAYGTGGASGTSAAYSDTYGEMIWDTETHRYIPKRAYEELLIKRSQLYILDEFTKDI